MGAQISAFFTSRLKFNRELVRKFRRSTTGKVEDDLCKAGLYSPDHMKNSPNKLNCYRAELIKKSPLNTQAAIYENLGVKFPIKRAILLAAIILFVGLLGYVIALLVKPGSYGNKTTFGANNFTALSEHTITTTIVTEFPSTVIPRKYSSTSLPTEDPSTSGDKSRKLISVWKPITKIPYTSGRERLGTSLYEFLKLPAPPDEPLSEVNRSVHKVLSSGLSVELDHHVFHHQENHLRFSTATIYDPKSISYLLNGENLVGLKIITSRDSEALNLLQETSTLTSKNLRALVLEGPVKKQERTEHLKNIATCVKQGYLQNLEILIIENFYISKPDVKHLYVILEQNPLSFVIFRDTELCDRCVGVLDKLDSERIERLHFLWSNSDSETVAGATKNRVNTMTGLRELRLNIPLTVDEFERYLAKLRKLKIGEFTVNVDGKASANLWLLPTSNAEELHIHLSAVTKLPRKKMKIYLRDFSSDRLNLRRIYFYVKEDDFEISEDDHKWCVELSNISPDGILKITCSNDEVR